MKKTCGNCLNAYNNIHIPGVFCINKDFDAQFMDIPTTCSPGETCGRYYPRKASQEKIRWNTPVQLTLNFDSDE